MRCAPACEGTHIKSGNVPPGNGWRRSAIGFPAVFAIGGIPALPFGITGSGMLPSATPSMIQGAAGYDNSCAFAVDERAFAAAHLRFSFLRAPGRRPLLQPFLFWNGEPCEKYTETKFRVPPVVPSR